MEIFSYVQQQPKAKKILLPSLTKTSSKNKSKNSELNTYFSTFAYDSYLNEKKNKKSVVLHKKSPYVKNKAVSGTFSFYADDYSTFGAKSVPQKFSINLFLISAGKLFDSLIDFGKTYFRRLLIWILSALCFVALLYTGMNLYSQKINFTGAISLEGHNSADLENLNKLMAAFALDANSQIDENGTLLDSENLALNISNYNQALSFKTYIVRNGDTISSITKRFGLKNISSLISVNDISNVRQLASGQSLRIPNMDGIFYTVQPGDSIEKLVQEKNLQLDSLLDVNELSSEVLIPGQRLFLPGLGLDQKTLKLAMGDKFIIPIQASFRWTSPYGNRIDPIAGTKSFHTGTDMACPTGTPIVAAMSGKVSTTGTSRVWGNYVIIDHGNGYQTLYAHMSKIIAQKGQWLSQGTRIGLVGNTGYSTGPHLHFTVYKNGKMVDPMSVLK